MCPKNVAQYQTISFIIANNVQFSIFMQSVAHKTKSESPSTHPVSFIATKTFHIEATIEMVARLLLLVLRRIRSAPYDFHKRGAYGSNEFSLPKKIHTKICKISEFQPISLPRKINV